MAACLGGWQGPSSWGLLQRQSRSWLETWFLRGCRASALPTHLQEPGFEFPVQEHIKAQDLEAGTARDVVGEAGAVVVL